MFFFIVIAKYFGSIRNNFKKKRKDTGTEFIVANFVLE